MKFLNLYFFHTIILVTNVGSFHCRIKTVCFFAAFFHSPCYVSACLFFLLFLLLLPSLSNKTLFTMIIDFYFHPGGRICYSNENPFVSFERRQKGVARALEKVATKKPNRFLTLVLDVVDAKQDVNERGSVTPTIRTVS